MVFPTTEDKLAYSLSEVIAASRHLRTQIADFQKAFPTHELDSLILDGLQLIEEETHPEKLQYETEDLQARRGFVIETVYPGALQRLSEFQNHVCRFALRQRVNQIKPVVGKKLRIDLNGSWTHLIHLSNRLVVLQNELSENSDLKKYDLRKVAKLCAEVDAEWSQYHAKRKSAVISRLHRATKRVV